MLYHDQGGYTRREYNGISEPLRGQMRGFDGNLLLALSAAVFARHTLGRLREKW